MAITERARSRSIHKTTGAEERTRLWWTTSQTEDALHEPGIPAIGQEWPSNPEIVCIDLKVDYLTSNQDAYYSEVTARYSNNLPILVNPGDLKFDLGFSAKSEGLKYAPRVLHDGPTRYPDGAGVKRPIGQFGETGPSVLRPSFTIRVTKLYNRTMINADQSALYEGEGSVNDADWNGFPAQTMLFEGGEVPQTGNDRWTGTFSFSYDQGLHDYPWYYENTKTQEISDVVWSEQYPMSDFSLLGMDLPEG